MNEIYMNPETVRDLQPAQEMNPYFSAPGAPGRGAPISASPRSANRILVIDDDYESRRLCADVLVCLGHRVDTAVDGEMGWDLLNSASSSPESYDLLITDNKMPKVSGLDLIRDLRSARMTLPVILLSSQFPAVIDASIATGAPLKQFEWNRTLQINATLLKPFSVDALLQTVKKVLQADGKISGDK